MPTITAQIRKSPPIRGHASVHLFNVGQIVRIKPAFHGPLSKPTEVYRITRQLPSDGSLLQYRIKSDDETYERVVNEEGLEVAAKLRSLDEDVFINGTSDNSPENNRSDIDRERKYRIAASSPRKLPKKSI
ncbi:hypothetical protein [Methylocella sp. CPCC 101449]|uniref:hypothetical protein n=1 Tax=Methylocella sp. CPCC 101449 TaxID=2987531 RepID=UPI00288D35C5|nr:hypothetical protein [Methylocella sp. CPCC 101449]MDT2021258.1 hypothetical protein [Methylocella sp. CPCC 101449]